MPLPIVPIAMALAQIAPSLMKWLGAGDQSVAVAEKAVGIAQTITGTSTPEEALAALKADAALAQQYQLAVLAADTDLEKAYLADIANARDREVKIAIAEDAPYINKIATPVLAFIVVVCGFAILAWSDNESARQAVQMLMMLVLGYYFGTSQGSTKANQLMRDIARKA